MEKDNGEETRHAVNAASWPGGAMARPLHEQSRSKETTMPDRFHLGWFCNFSSGEWNHPFASGLPRWHGKIFVEMAQAMERACFDYIMLEDTLMVSEAYRGTAEATLKHALQA